MTRGPRPFAVRRLYFSSDSYPELREIGSRWERHLAWSRAFRRACRDVRFWRFAITQIVMLVGWLIAAHYTAAWLGGDRTYRSMLHVLVLAAAILAWGLCMLSWGGDLMRPHLRATSGTARDACPGCGHQMTGQLERAGAELQCPECGERIPTTVFKPPYEIPWRFRAIRR